MIGTASKVFSTRPGAKMKLETCLKRTIFTVWPATWFAKKGPAITPEAKSLASQSLNNAAVILYEHGYTAQARRLLEKAVQVCPDNLTARDNLNSLLQGG